MTTTHATLKERITTFRSKPDPAELAQIFIEAFPKLDTVQQHLVQKLYFLLAEGEPVSLERLAASLGRPVKNVTATLKAWPAVFYDEAGQVIGFWGISVEPRAHRFEVAGRTAFTWCALDSLFIPAVIGTNAEVTSPCAQTGETIRLTVTPTGAVSREHPDVVVSFIIPDIEKLQTNITASFCHFVHFFRDRAVGEQWVAGHKGTFLLSLDEAFAVGKKLLTVFYGEVPNS